MFVKRERKKEAPAVAGTSFFNKPNFLLVYSAFAGGAGGTGGVVAAAAAGTAAVEVDVELVFTAGISSSFKSSWKTVAVGSVDVAGGRMVATGAAGAGVSETTGVGVAGAFVGVIGEAGAVGAARGSAGAAKISAKSASLASTGAAGAAVGAIGRVGLIGGSGTSKLSDAEVLTPGVIRSAALSASGAATSSTLSDVP